MKIITTEKSIVRAKVMSNIDVIMDMDIMYANGNYIQYLHFYIGDTSYEYAATFNNPRSLYKVISKQYLAKVQTAAISDVHDFIKHYSTELTCMNFDYSKILEEKWMDSRTALQHIYEMAMIVKQLDILKNISSEALSHELLSRELPITEAKPVKRTKI